MKNQIHPLRPEQHAITAIQRIQKWVEIRYPRLSRVAKTKLIMECLIEVCEEKRYVAAQ